MKVLNAAVLALSLLIAPSAFADAKDKPADADKDKAKAKPVENIENAKTPTSLLELLPKDEKDWPKPVYLKAVPKRIDNGGRDETMFFYFGIKREKKDIVFEFKVGDPDRTPESSRLVYSADGKLKGFSSLRDSSYSTKTENGVVVGDNLEITRTYAYKPRPNREVRPPRTSTRTVPLKDIGKAYPLEWMPLIAAYHFKKGSLGYTVPLMIAGQFSHIADLKVEDIGTENVKHEGKDKKAHVLNVTVALKLPPGATRAPKEKDGKMTIKFLEDGGFLSFTLMQDKYKVTAERVTEKEIPKSWQQAKKQ